MCAKTDIRASGQKGIKAEPQQATGVLATWEAVWIRKEKSFEIIKKLECVSWGNRQEVRWFLLNVGGLLHQRGCQSCGSFCNVGMQKYHI